MIQKKRYLTLIEVMIVMFIITSIVGVLAYNYQGSLEEGKAFKTRAAIEKVTTIITLKMAEDGDFDPTSDWESAINLSPLVQSKEALKKDGWGEPFQVQINGDGEITVSSSKYDQYRNKKK